MNYVLAECEHAQPGDYSMLMPSVFAEVLLRVYTRDVQYVPFYFNSLATD
jgi:hypothetical protein